MGERTLHAVWLGRRRYGPVHALQRALNEARKQGASRDTLLLLEHEPVITLGRGAHPQNILFSPQELAARGVDVCETGRGGDVTFHGPGQLVGYPIVALAPDRCDVRRYVRDLVAVMIALARDHGLDAGTIERHVGVWIDKASPGAWPGEQQAREPAKIGAVGVRLSRWVSMHGFAFNARIDPAAFSVIVPCGIHEFSVTSLQALLGRAPSPEQLAARAAELLSAQLGARLTGVQTVDAPDDLLCEALGVEPWIGAADELAE
jgi:lipoyl(octanoyl) transferase